MPNISRNFWSRISQTHEIVLRQFFMLNSNLRHSHFDRKFVSMSN